MALYKKIYLLLFLGVNCTIFVMHKNGLSKTSSFVQNPANRLVLQKECAMKLQESIVRLSEEPKKKSILKNIESDEPKESLKKAKL
jgi:hypothetical protein